jgi:hypothetical protein
VADLHYADTPEYATGHGVSAEWDDRGPRHVACCALHGSRRAEVEKTDRGRAGRRAGDGGARRAGPMAPAVRAALRPLVGPVPRVGSSVRRSRALSAHCQRRAARNGGGTAALPAGVAADRIERGIAVLAGRRRRPRRLPGGQPRRRARTEASGSGFKDKTPRLAPPSSLAFILLNLPGLVDPSDPTARSWTCSSSHRRRQDRGLPWPGGFRDGAATAATPGRARGSRVPG